MSDTAIEALRYSEFPNSSDCISRQAAIDVINESNSPIAEYLIGEIMALPSAQPETHDKHTKMHACDLIDRQPSSSCSHENDTISRTAAIDALHMHLMYRMGTDSNKKRLDDWINSLPSAQPECAKDFVMLKVIDLNGRPYYSIIYLENGNEFEGYSSYDLKVISEYLKRYFGFAQPQRQKGEWIDYTEDGYVECPFCHNATNCDGNKDELHFCFSCGADMREVDDERPD